ISTCKMIRPPNSVPQLLNVPVMGFSASPPHPLSFHIAPVKRHLPSPLYPDPRLFATELVFDSCGFHAVFPGLFGHIQRFICSGNKLSNGLAALVLRYAEAGRDGG